MDFVAENLRPEHCDDLAKLSHEGWLEGHEKSGWFNKRSETILLDTLADPFKLELWPFEKALI